MKQNFFLKTIQTLLVFSLAFTLTNCGNIDNPLEELSGSGNSGGSTNETPTVEEIIKYGFKVTDLAGNDKTTLVTSLKMSTDDGPVATAEVSDGKITIEADKLSGITSAIDFWFEAEIDGKPYIAKVNIDPSTLSPETVKTLAMATVGDVILADGSFAKAGTETPNAMIAYVGSGSDCKHGLAIQLNSSPVSKKWKDDTTYPAKEYAEGLTAVPGGTWRLPSKADWQNMFLGCAKSGDASSASDNMNPIAGFKEKIAAAGVTWQSYYYWSSTESENEGRAWFVGVHLNDGYAYADFHEYVSVAEYYVLGCLAF